MDENTNSRTRATPEDPEICSEEGSRHGPAYDLPPALEYTEEAGHGDIERRDGMAEYAAGYSEHPPAAEPSQASAETLKHDSANECKTGEGARMEPPKYDDLNRRELTEPDGSSGPSSPLVTIQREPPSETQPSMQPPGETRRTPKDAKPSTSKQKTEISIEVITPTDQSIERNGKSSKDGKTSDTNIPNIPNTNIAVACLVTFCFNLPLGAVAIYFALMSAKAYRDRKPKTGAKRALISIYISLAAIVLTVLIVMLVVLLLATKGHLRQRRYAATKTSISQ